jgi:hypothetical protein
MDSEYIRNASISQNWKDIRNADTNKLANIFKLETFRHIYASNIKTNGTIMKRLILLTKLLPIIFIGTLSQAQINSKVNLSFEDKIQSWSNENDVQAVGIRLIENGEIKYVKVLSRSCEDI